MSLFKNVTNCGQYDQAAANLQDEPLPEGVEKIGGLTPAQALQLYALESRLHRRDVLLFRRLTRILIRYGSSDPEWTMLSGGVSVVLPMPCGTRGFTINLFVLQQVC